MFFSLLLFSGYWWVWIIIFSMFLTAAWCVEGWVPIPDPVHGGLGRMQDSTGRARFCHISTRLDGFRGFVPPTARVSRISRASDPTWGEWGTFAAVEDNLVPKWHICFICDIRDWHQRVTPESDTRDCRIVEDNFVLCIQVFGDYKDHKTTAFGRIRPDPKQNILSPKVR